jgi:hypothetical protein
MAPARESSHTRLVSGKRAFHILEQVHDGRDLKKVAWPVDESEPQLFFFGKTGEGEIQSPPFFHHVVTGLVERV